MYRDLRSKTIPDGKVSVTALALQVSPQHYHQSEVQGSQNENVGEDGGISVNNKVPPQVERVEV